MASPGGSKSGIAVRTNRASSVAAESRVRGGLKVSTNGASQNKEPDVKTVSRSPPGPGSAVKRKIGKSWSNSVQIGGDRSPSNKKKCADLSDSRVKSKSPVQSQRRKSLRSASDDADLRSAIQIPILRSHLKSSNVKEPLEASGSDPSFRIADQTNSADEKNGVSEAEFEKGESETDESEDRRKQKKGESETEETRSDGEKEDDQEDGGDESDENSEEEEEDEEEEGMDEEIEIEKDVVVEQDISCDETIQAENEKNIFSDEDVVDVAEKNVSDDCQDKEMNVPQPKPKDSSKSTVAQFSPVKKQPPPKFSRPAHSTPVRDGDSDAKLHRGPETHSTLQNLVDLVMWKYVPRSALVFGVGTFLIVSSAYTKDVNISFISVTSYLGLIYLGISFLYRSFKCRNVPDGNDASYCHGLSVIGEEEAIWLSRLILPSLNEFLLKLRALFSGDPAVTMKLAAVLFALARCGSSITIWNMVKLGFFTAFILPKFCSSYSAQITRYGKFWIRRFRDVWRSCSHKKLVAFAMFTIVWNLSSVVARIWAAFMLFVAIRYYQQSTIKAQTWDEVEVDTGRTPNDDEYILRRRPQVTRKLRQGRPSTTQVATTPVDRSQRSQTKVNNR